MGGLFRIGMQTREEVRQIHPEEGYDDDGEAEEGAEGVYVGVFSGEHAAKVEVGDVDEPGGERPEFLRVPAPVISPGEFSPDATEDEAEG